MPAIYSFLFLSSLLKDAEKQFFFISPKDMKEKKYLARHAN